MKPFVVDIFRTDSKNNVTKRRLESETLENAKHLMEVHSQTSDVTRIKSPLRRRHDQQGSQQVDREQERETYEATNSEYRRNSESHEYFVIPTRYPKQTRVNRDYRNWKSSKPIPRGWVDISKITGSVVRRLYDGYIRQRLALSKSNIAYNQHYIERILNNPKTPKCNREAAIEFVKDHPDYFTPRPTDTPFEDLNRHNPVINGDNPDKKFLSRFI